MITETSFGILPSGERVRLFTLALESGVRVCIADWGGVVTSIRVPDANEQLGEVTLGFDTLEAYLSEEYRRAAPYFGALVGRYANRIGEAAFSLDGQRYELDRNNGRHSLHGGRVGFDKALWEARVQETPDGPSLILRHTSPNGDEGFPGQLQVEVVYTLLAPASLRIEYSAVTDTPTPVNLTQHSYFNLSHDSGAGIGNHALRMPAGAYVVVDAEGIPTGEVRSVEGSPFDFRASRLIGQGGYDHTWVLPGPRHLQPAAEVYDPASGRTLEVLTDQPGVHLYTGNFLDGSLRGHGGVVYGPQTGFCLETQHFPNSPNQPGFPDTILRPGQVFRSQTVYSFGVRAGQDT